METLESDPVVNMDPEPHSLDKNVSEASCESRFRAQWMSGKICIYCKGLNPRKGIIKSASYRSVGLITLLNFLTSKIS